MQLSDRVWLLESTPRSHAYLILGEEPLLIDSGMPGQDGRILAELAAIGLAPSDLAHILLTHHDVDHIGNARSLQAASGAKVWAPVEDLPYIHGERHRPGIKHLVDLLLRPQAPDVDQVYGAGQWIGDVEVIPTPGHTPGHISLRFGDMLFAGDLVGTRRGQLRVLPGMLNWDPARMRQSIREVGRLSFDWVCPAHGDPVRRGDLWEALLAAE